MRKVIVLVLLATVILAAPEVTACSTAAAKQSLILSDEGPGLITQLTAAGYGGYSTFDATVQLQYQSDPQIAGIVTDSFLHELQTCPAGSQVFTTRVRDFAGKNVAVSDDGTVQVVPVRGAPYEHQAGAANLDTTFATVGSYVLTHATSSPLTTWQANGATYNAFAIAWMRHPSQSIVLSDEGRGLVTNMATAGYGEFTVWDSLLQVVYNSDPSVSPVITDAFLTSLQSCPAGSRVFTAKVKDFVGTALAISDDCTAQAVALQGAAFEHQAGVTSLATTWSGVGSYLLTHSTTAGSPLTSWQAGGTAYDALAIAWMRPAVAARLFPGIASVAGANSTRWRSEAVLANPGAAAAEAKLELIPRDAAAVTATVSHTVQPGVTVRLADLYADLGVASGAGMLRLTSALPAWVRTFNQGNPGTFGQDVPPVTLDDAFAASTDVLFPVTTPADPAHEFRSNLLVLNLEAAPITFSLSAAGKTTSFTVPGGTYHQVDKIGTVMGLPAGLAALAVRATGRWSGTVSAVDPGSGDPTTMRGLLPTTRDVVLFPGVASNPGANQTQWRSEGLVCNRSTAARTVLLELLPKDGSTVSASTSLTLAAGEIRRLADLYAALHATQGSGMLRVTGDVLTWVRTYNQGTTATFGQDVPPVLPSGGTVAGVEVLFPIARPADKGKDVRSNLLLVNHETFKITCTVTAGATSKTTDVPAGAYAQVNDVGAWLGVPTGWATIAVRANGRWSGTVSTIDPYTGDPTTVIGIQR